MLRIRKKRNKINIYLYLYFTQAQCDAIYQILYKDTNRFFMITTTFSLSKINDKTIDLNITLIKVVSISLFQYI